MKKIFYIATLFGAIGIAGMMLSCDKDKQLPPEDTVERVLPPVEAGDDGTDGENPNDPKDYVHAVAFMTAEDADMRGSGIDLASGQVFRGPDAHNYPHAVDLLYLDYGNTTKGNIALPESIDLSVNVYGEDVQYGWRHKNSGVLYCLEDVQPRDVAWFNGAKSAARISAVVDSMITVLSADPDNQKKRFRDVQKDRVFIFKSTTRNIASVIYVSQQMTTGTGSQCRLIIKSDATQLQEVAPVTGGLLNANGNYYADVIEITFESPASTHEEFFLDLKEKKAYKQSELQNSDYVRMNFILGRRSSNNQLYLFTPTSGPGKSNYANTTLNAHLDVLSTSGYLSATWKSRRLDDHASYNANNNNFENSRLNNEAIYDFYRSITNNGWSSHYTASVDARNLVGRVYSISNRPDTPAYNQLAGRTDIFFGSLRVISYDSGTGKVIIEVKSSNSLD